MRLILISIISAAIMASCATDFECPSGEPMVKGTVLDYTGLDGCGFVIKLSDGKILEPCLVDSSFVMKDHQKVWLSYKPVSAASICMVGEMVEVTCIRER